MRAITQSVGSMNLILQLDGQTAELHADNRLVGVTTNEVAVEDLATALEKLAKMLREGDRPRP